MGKHTPGRTKGSGTAMSGCGGAQALHTAQPMPWESLGWALATAARASHEGSAGAAMGSTDELATGTR